MRIEDMFEAEAAAEAERAMRRRRMLNAAIEVAGTLAALAGLAFFAWLCVAASDYGWR